MRGSGLAAALLLGAASAWGADSDGGTPMARDRTSADDDELVGLPSTIAVTSDDEDAVEIRTLLMTRDGGTVDGSARAVLATSQGPVDLDAGIDGGFLSIDVPEASLERGKSNVTVFIAPRARDAAGTVRRIVLVVERPAADIDLPGEVLIPAVTSEPASARLTLRGNGRVKARSISVAASPVFPLDGGIVAGHGVPSVCLFPDGDGGTRTPGSCPTRLEVLSSRQGATLQLQVPAQEAPGDYASSVTLSSGTFSGPHRLQLRVRASHCFVWALLAVLAGVGLAQVVANYAQTWRPRAVVAIWIESARSDVQALAKTVPAGNPLARVLADLERKLVELKLDAPLIGADDTVSRLAKLVSERDDAFQKRIAEANLVWTSIAAARAAADAVSTVAGLAGHVAAVRDAIERATSHLDALDVESAQADLNQVAPDLEALSPAAPTAKGLARQAQSAPNSVGASRISKAFAPLKRSRRTIERFDWALAAVALVIAVLTGFSFLYFGKPFGTVHDYLEAVLWGFGIDNTVRGLKAVAQKFLGK